jgi:hypothetical protein
MDRDPYAAPKSNVRDVSPQPASHGIRTKWWDVLFFCLIGTAVLGSFVDDPILIVVGLLPGLALIAVIVIGAWVIEARHCVRIYSKARALVFVEAGNG